MKRFIILAAVTALAVARPELYKEKEDFQFSRSSSDDGTKAGFYGAQRGNMGGNYERAHNMDLLAQNQMSGLVRQVEGELGDGAKMRTGSVYTAANSRGTYGSRNFDLSNLEGRNFQEGVSHDTSHLRSSALSSVYNNAGYTNSRSQTSMHRGYQTAEHTGMNLQSDNLQTLDNAQASRQYDYGRQDRLSAGYAGDSGSYGSNVQTRLVSATPVRIIVRPGTKVAIPVSAQTYDVGHGSLINQNSLNSEAEVLSNDNQRTVYSPSNAKHYEASYNYRKSWEKHDTIPSTVSLPVSTESPFPRHSELYEDSQARLTNDRYDASRVDTQRTHSSNIYSGYNANVKSASSQSGLNYNTQYVRASPDANSNAYTLAGSTQQRATSDSGLNSFLQTQSNGGARYHGAVADSSSLTQAGYNTRLNSDLNSQLEDLGSKPKSYQSSYSYHKSWERQGDPYVIKPASGAYYDDQSSQRLTSAASATKNQGFAVSGSHYRHSHQSSADCDESGHLRVARSYNSDPYQDMQQQSQNLEEFGQQAEDLGQHVEDLGQQVQTSWDQQQSQNTWDKSENLGQQTQNKWDRIEDLGQQTQNKWDRIEDLGQQTQNINFEDLQQHTQDTNGKLETLEQQTQNDLGPHIQDFAMEQKPQNPNVMQESQHKWDFGNTEHIHQESVFEQTHANSQQTQEDQNQVNIPELPPYFQHFQKENDNHNLHQINVWNKFDQFGSQQSESQNFESQSGHVAFNDKSFNSFNRNSVPEHQQSHTVWSNSQQTWHSSNNLNTYSSSHNQTANTNSQLFGNSFESTPSNMAPLSSLWDKINKIDLLSTDKKIGKDFPHTSTQNSYQNPRQEPTFHSTNTLTQTQINTEVINNTNKPKEIQLPSSKDIERPQDVGRGDIGPEDLPDSDVNKHNLNSFGTTDSKTGLEEKEIKEGNNQNGAVNIGKELSSPELSVLSLQQQNSQEKINQNNFSATNNTNKLEFIEQQNKHDLSRQEILEKQTLHDILQENLNENYGHHSHHEQQNLQGFEQQENVEQHNLQGFGQQANLDQQNLEDFKQQENLEQQSLQDFGHQGNLEQLNLQDFGNQENVEQQSLQDFGQQENLQEQQNTHSIGQQNLNQDNLKDFETQEVQKQQILQNFGQQHNLEEQNVPDFRQQENLDQQNLQDFSQQEILEQQNLQDFRQQENFAQQNLQDFGQQENLAQQNLQDFGQQENLAQQNLQDFGQQENLAQQNLQDFGQQENLAQQNLQDFGQQENVEQKNLQDFGQQANREHQISQNLGQHTQKQQELQEFPEHYESLDKLDQQSTYSRNHKTAQDLPQPAEVEEPIFIQNHNNDSQSISAQSPTPIVESPIETDNEKSGFWKSVGNKFSSAKSKVASWFKS